jgi:hypothetical protein
MFLDQDAVDRTLLAAILDRFGLSGKMEKVPG